MIFLQILKIIGFVAAGIVALAVLVVLLVAFAPFRYRLAGKGADADITVTASFKWLLGLFTARAAYREKKIEYYVRVFGIKILKGNLDTDELAVKDSEKGGAEQESESSGKDAASKDAEDGVDGSAGKHDDDGEGSGQAGTITKAVDKLKALWEKITGIWNKIKTVKYILTAPVTERAWNYTKVRLFRLLGHMRPRKLKGRAQFGTGDPATTAQGYGVAAAFAGMISPGFMIVPDMENKIIDLDMSICGRIFVGYVVLLALQIVTNKNVRRVLGYVKKNL